MKAIIVSLFISTFFVSCNRKNCDFEGKLIGADYSLCACCGGWFIQKGEGDTLRYFYNGDNSELNERIKDTLNYPINIRFSCKEVEGACSDWAKEMTCYEILD
jgi:hypothetical protein